MAREATIVVVAALEVGGWATADVAGTTTSGTAPVGEIDEKSGVLACGLRVGGGRDTVEVGRAEALGTGICVAAMCT
jgi:hypothetical protein